MDAVLPSGATFVLHAQQKGSFQGVKVGAEGVGAISLRMCSHARATLASSCKLSIGIGWNAAS